MDPESQGRREVTLDELEELQRAGLVKAEQVQATGIAVIKDKDGNVKSKLEITSIEINED